MYKAFFKATLVRMLRTFAESALAYIGTAAMLHDVNWIGVLSAGAMGAVVSFLMAVSTGLPEVSYDKASDLDETHS